MNYRVKNWGEYQHYKDRNPSWVKLHKRLLDDYEFQCLPVASRALAPMLWLLASESQEGTIDGDLRKIAFRLHMTESDVQEAIEPLVTGGFLECSGVASKPLAQTAQVAIPEKEKQPQTQVTTKTEGARKRADQSLEEFWAGYPRKIGKGQARKAWTAATKKATVEEIMAGLKAYKFSTEQEFIPHPATWLNGERWLDEPDGKPKSDVPLEKVFQAKAAMVAKGLPTKNTPTHEELARMVADELVTVDQARKYGFNGPERGVGVASQHLVVSDSGDTRDRAVAPIKPNLRRMA